VTAEIASPNPSGWERVSSAGDTPEGTVTFRLDSWSRFFDFLEAEVFDPSLASKSVYTWRGQRRSDWSLSSSLDRLFGKLDLLAAGPGVLEDRLAEHLDSFKYASRGRRGYNPATLLENEWWALGQHFGLATPLLDWTRSPFAAAYFAFEELAADPTEYRVVYGLARNAVTKKSEEISESISDLKIKQRAPVIEFIDPMSDENQRLVSQDGLFTRAPIGLPIEQWVAREFEGSSSAVLLRIEIPDADRLACLRALNRMNINHLSLFPDLTGASRATNLKLELR
jgi:hypothetical protein